MTGVPDDFVIVTASSAYYFDRLQNFMGSVGVWEPGQHVAVYDLGLDADQVRQVSCWANVTLVRFPFDDHPVHVRNLFNYAWKILMLQDALARWSAVLVLDAGIELRQPLTRAKRILAASSYFSVRQSNYVDVKTHDGTFAALGIDKTSPGVRGHGFCAGGVQGYLRHGHAHATMLPRAIACALDERCIAPPGSGRSNHNYDQSVLTALAAVNGHDCEPGSEFSEGYMHRVTLDETRRNAVVLSLRRWQLPGPYPKYIRSADGGVVADRSSGGGGTRGGGRGGGRSGSCMAKPPPYVPKDEGLIENYPAAHIMPESPLAQCLVAHNNSRTVCGELAAHHRHLGLTSVQLSWRRYMVIAGTALWKVLLCASFVPVTVAVAAAAVVYRNRRQCALAVLQAAGIVAALWARVRPGGERVSPRQGPVSGGGARHNRS